MSLAVCVLVLGYTLLGAFVFMALEGGLKSVRRSIKSRDSTDNTPQINPQINPIKLIRLRSRLQSRNQKFLQTCSLIAVAL